MLCNILTIWDKSLSLTFSNWVAKLAIGSLYSFNFEISSLDILLAIFVPVVAVFKIVFIWPINPLEVPIILVASFVALKISFPILLSSGIVTLLTVFTILFICVFALFPLSINVFITVLLNSCPEPIIFLAFSNAVFCVSKKFCNVFKSFIALSSLELLNPSKKLILALINVFIVVILFIASFIVFNLSSEFPLLETKFFKLSNKPLTLPISLWIVI